MEAMAACWGRWDRDIEETFAPPWVYDCPSVSPATVQLVALAIADVVNDLHNNEFFASFGRLAGKVCVHRNTVRRVVRHLTAVGVLVELERGRPGSDKPGRYRWCWFGSQTPRSGPPEDIHTVAQPARPLAQPARPPRAACATDPNTNPTDVNQPLHPENEILGPTAPQWVLLDISRDEWLRLQVDQAREDGEEDPLIRGSTGPDATSTRRGE